jgi:hypothetical protein
MISSRVAALLLLLPVGQAVPTSLRITDSQGTAVVVAAASIDYSGLFSFDRETQGIRVMQGDGLVLLKWTDVDSVRIRPDSTTKPPGLTLEVSLKGGKKGSATVLKKGQMKLLGKTDLGDYSIEMEKVRTIAPAR